VPILSLLLFFSFLSFLLPWQRRQDGTALGLQLWMSSGGAGWEDRRCGGWSTGSTTELCTGKAAS
jgi:hypothetical protein